MQDKFFKTFSRLIQAFLPFNSTEHVFNGLVFALVSVRIRVNEKNRDLHNKIRNLSTYVYNSKKKRMQSMKQGWDDSYLQHCLLNHIDNGLFIPARTKVFC